MILQDGCINLDTERGKALGFTSDRFDGYLWKAGDTVVISFIVSLKKGNFKQLVDTILSLGLSVQVPTPLGRMRDILERNGYTQSFKFCEEFGEDVELWTLQPRSIERQSHGLLQ